MKAGSKSPVADQQSTESAWSASGVSRTISVLAGTAEYRGPVEFSDTVDVCTFRRRLSTNKLHQVEGKSKPMPRTWGWEQAFVWRSCVWPCAVKWVTGTPSFLLELTRVQLAGQIDWRSRGPGFESRLPDHAPPFGVRLNSLEALWLPIRESSEGRWNLSGRWVPKGLQRSLAPCLRCAQPPGSAWKT